MLLKICQVAVIVGLTSTKKYNKMDEVAPYKKEEREVKTRKKWFLFLLFLLLTLIILSMLTFFSYTHALKKDNELVKVRFPAVYFDLHSTLLDPDYKLHPDTIKALAKYRRCGGNVGIATGGSFEQVKPYLKDLDLNLPLILFDGAKIRYSNNNDLSDAKLYPLPKETVLQIAEIVDQIPHTRGIIVWTTTITLIDRDAPEMMHALDRMGVQEYMIDIGLTSVSVFQPLKFTIQVEKDMGEVVRAWLKDKLTAWPVRIVVSSPWSVEIIDPRVNKYNALLEVTKKNGIDLRQTLTFGDNDNDIEMLSMGLGIAMGNCSPGACSAAGVKIGDNRSNAIARFFEKFVFTPKCK